MYEKVVRDYPAKNIHVTTYDRNKGISIVCSHVRITGVAREASIVNECVTTQHPGWSLSLPLEEFIIPQSTKSHNPLSIIAAIYCLHSPLFPLFNSLNGVYCHGEGEQVQGCTSLCQQVMVK